MIDYPLTPENRETLALAFQSVPRVDIAVDAVLAGEMGTVYVDDAQQPVAFQIAFPPFYYFAGDPHSAGGQSMVRAQSPDSLLMPSAPGWLAAFRKVHGARLVPVERYAFANDALDEAHLAELVARSPFRDVLVQLDRILAKRLAGDDEGVVDLSAFASLDHFLHNGVGYCLLESDTVTGVAFSSLAHPQAIEVSIFVEPGYREQGRATALGAALLRATLVRGQRPNWDAANPESVRLAEKLGYRFDRAYEAHWLVI